MAKFTTHWMLAFAMLTFCLQATTFPMVGAEPEDGIGRNHNLKKLHGLKREKLTRIKVYWQDVLSGKNPTSIPVLKPMNGSRTFFGQVVMFDNALTEGPNVDSKAVGRAQGFYASTGQTQLHLLMAMNFVFTEGKYNGSTLAVYGDNAVYNWRNVREVPVVGGTGLFRFARGYALLHTTSLDFKTGDATIEYDVYVRH